jgi:hypothetical protein
MTALHAKQPTPILDIRHEVICDQCHKTRAHGNHRACSKARQAMHARLREKS